MPPTIRSRRHAVPELWNGVHRQLRYGATRQQQFVFDPTTGLAQAIIGWLAQDNAGVSTGLSGYGVAVLKGSTWYNANGLLGFATPAAFKPGNPSSTVSTTPGQMMGLGTTIQFTPTKTGIVQVTLTGIAGTNTALVGFGITPKYGTGTAPANGDSPSGTGWGVATGTGVEATAAGTRSFVIYQDRITGLTPSTAYWFDVALFTANAADAAVLAGVSCIINETN